MDRKTWSQREWRPSSIRPWPPASRTGISPRDYIIDTLKAILTRKPVRAPLEWKSVGLMEDVLGTN